MKNDYTNDELSLDKAEKQYSEIIEGIKKLVAPFMKTKEGRDQIRKTFGCRIEGCEEEEKGLPIDEWFKNKR